MNKPSLYHAYLKAIQKNLALGDATEHTHRHALKTLLEVVGDGITATNEPKRIRCGAPDFRITRRAVPLGHVETKDVSVDLDEIELGKGAHGEQFIRYHAGLPNWILTDYLEFRWFVAGDKRLTARLGTVGRKGAIVATPGGEDQVAQLLDAFFSHTALTVGTARELASRMAGMTRIIRDLIIGTFEREQAKGWLHSWLAAFREVIIPDLGEKQFADMFAQTLAYGLFAARVHASPDREFSREMAAFNLPKTNPFLRKLFAEIGGVDMPETIDWAVDDLVALLRHADMDEILKDFGKGRGKEDPVVHFYETFLATYDPAIRELRGVYYTPEPVVSYIVRSIDHLLRVHFDLPKGLADENIFILDPALGTGTFLYFVIDQICHTFVDQKGAWDTYVSSHLLNRLFGFELLMAPYAVAHLKLGMELQRTGYEFTSDQRLGVYLTNTLEEAAKKSEKLFANWISDEAGAAADIKTRVPIMVVLGNPPYSGHSANKGEWIKQLVDDYRRRNGRPVKLEQAKWLQDDYIKFIRFGEWRIARTESGILGFITNHSYLDSPTFVRMREHLAETFTDIFILDLHGNLKKQARSPDGSKDENVFDIQQGVAIAMFVKRPLKRNKAEVHFAELWGSREAKYQWLKDNSVLTTKWTQLPMHSPENFFVQRSVKHKAEYDRGWSIRDIFSPNGQPAPGFLTTHDQFAMAFTRKEIIANVQALLETDSEAEARGLFRLCSQAQWNYRKAKQSLASNNWRKAITPCLYRPFDIRWTVYDPHVLVHRRERVTRHLLRGPNLGLITSRLTKGEQFKHVLVSDLISEVILLSPKTSNNAFVFPLYRYDPKDQSESQLAIGTQRRPNLSAEFLRELLGRVGLKWVEEGPGDLKKTAGPDAVFQYVYAILHSATYRTRYAEFLTRDFPRVPLTDDRKQFATLAEKGGELVSLHLLKSPAVNELISSRRRVLA